MRRTIETTKRIEFNAQILFLDLKDLTREIYQSIKQSFLKHLERFVSGLRHLHEGQCNCLRCKTFRMCLLGLAQLSVSGDD